MPEPNPVPPQSPPPTPPPSPEQPVVPPDDPNRPFIEREPSIDPPPIEPPLELPSEKPVITEPPAPRARSCRLHGEPGKATSGNFYLRAH